MPFVPVAQRSQTRTVGMNGQLKIGRSSTTTKEFDCKNFTDAWNWAVQDKTGSFAQGYEDGEMGPIRLDFSADLINHVDDPIDLRDPNCVWYVEAIIDGFGTTSGYFALTAMSSNPTMNADHAVSFSARSVVRKESQTVNGVTTTTTILPKFVKYVAA